MLDARKRLEEYPFAYRATRAGEVHVSYRHRLVTIVRGAEAEKLLSKIADADELAQQLLLAKVTGNFKHEP